ncbi:hypothetical protein C2G38_2203066 [Gigaspora rosea]|uniref:Uncharacterized protein n=1 Tax=Gigaspora rosea TaxID=44941 RepID=A0A397UMW6_9GLOM|nr:hypothetical protein C2G38_2203066 [Gigaspora rosea]
MNTNGYSKFRNNCKIINIKLNKNINTFEKRLEKEGFDKDELLLIDNLNFRNFPDEEDNDEDLLLEINKILENINVKD